jgi:hypothetical protein
MRDIFFILAIVFLIIAASRPSIFQKDEHKKRMELIEELNQLVHLQQGIELKQTSEKVDSLRRVINSELNEK